MPSTASSSLTTSPPRNTCSHFDAGVGQRRVGLTQICKGISYDAGAMTRMIDRLEQRGILRRVRVADDRRT